MTENELIEEFNILFEDLATAGSKGLDNYEKSICYTYAQEQIVKQLAIQGQLTHIRDLVKIDTSLVGTFTASKYKTGKNIAIPPTLLQEIAYFATDTDRDITGALVPQQVIDTMLSMPYHYPPKHLVYVVVGEDTNIVFFPLNFTPVSFSTRYVEYPTPVILEALTGDDSINELTALTLPILNDAYLKDLVTAAVQYAITIYIGQPEKEVPNGNTRNK